MSTPESPLPWRFENGYILSGEHKVTIVVDYIADGDSKHIVHCVNTHAALVEALKEVRLLLGKVVPSGDIVDKSFIELAKEVAAEALRQAEEGK